MEGRATMSSSTYPLSRERNVILILLLALAVAAWVFLFWQARSIDMTMAGLTMGMGPLVFLASWVVMMIAMMFPTAAPMILTFNRVYTTRRERGQAFVPTWVFVAGYLVVWTAFGVVGYVAAVVVQSIAAANLTIAEIGPRVGGVLIVLAGVYQLTPLKRTCLTACRTPLDFIMRSWRDGYGGAFRMGLEHGSYCLGCCWLLFVILFPLGMMNVGAMALITLLIFAEKSLPIGPRVGVVAAAIMVAYGLLVVAVPETLPTVMPGMAM